MPELAEVEYFRKQWNPGLGKCIDEVLLHPKARIFRGIDLPAMKKSLTGAKLERSEASGKQMLFVARRGKEKSHAWLGIHLGMTGHLKAEAKDYSPAKHDHLVLRQKNTSLVFQDARLFGRVQFADGAEAPKWWSSIAPALISAAFTEKALAEFLKRRKGAPLKAVLLMQERFPGVGNWMADEILWRAGLHPRQLAGELEATQTQELYKSIRSVCRDALRIIGARWDDPPKSWLFSHRWRKGGTCPATGAKLQHATIGGRTTCWSPKKQKLR